MIVKQLLPGGDRNFSYIAGDKEGCSGIIIDPSYNPEMILEEAKKLGLEVKYIFCTHGHSDHTNGNNIIRKLTGKIPLLYGHTDSETGITISDGVKLPLGSLDIKIIHTPGHTEDSMCLYTGNALFTGDTLFTGKVGGTHSREDSLREYYSLHEKLMTLPEETVVYPGHNYGISPTSTVGKEKKSNPFIIQPDFGAFLYLKNNWAEYKLEHGIK
jgi:glyoxylase-like metal-dependent hydrolase (beta-lactamase superfamily II)